MIYILDASLNVLRCLPDHIYQGSSEAGRLTVIAPFSEDTQLSVAFYLTTGENTPRLYMQYAGKIPDVSAEEGQNMYAWRAEIPALVTARYGTVIAQFYGVNAQGEVIATARISFTVERGVENSLPEWPDENSFEQILGTISALMSNLKNAAYAARALFAWNSVFTYSYDEIVYCPDVNEHGTFVRTLVAENTQPPYGESGAINTAYWKEICRFDDIFEQAADALGAKDTAVQSAAAASASAIQARASENSAAASAKQAADKNSACEMVARSAENSANLAASSAQAAIDAKNQAETIIGGDFAQQADMEKIISGKQKVGAALQADSAVKAIQDGNGKVIADTYSTKEEYAQTVRFTSQSLSASQKTQTRQNIGAIDENANVLSVQQINNESNVVIGRNGLNSLSAGKLYISCVFQNAVLSEAGSYYMQNCSGTLTVPDSGVYIYVSE